MHDDDLRNMFTAYMQKVVYHAKIDYIRRRANQRKTPETPRPEWQGIAYEQDFRLAPENEFEFEEQRLANRFASLPFVRRQILTLLFVEGYTAMEVAEQLGCSLDYVYSNKRRALQKLREQMEKGGDDDAV
jgi:RNA polymerase sigma factor (sigma-70 family)